MQRAYTYPESNYPSTFRKEITSRAISRFQTRPSPPLSISNEPCLSGYIFQTSDRLLCVDATRDAGWFSQGKSAVWPPIDPLRSCLRYALNPLRRALNQTTPTPRIQSPISIVTPRYAFHPPPSIPKLLTPIYTTYQSSYPWKLIRIAFAHTRFLSKPTKLTPFRTLSKF